jgi:hypothetical protein
VNVATTVKRKHRKVGVLAIDQLTLVVEAEVKRRGLYGEWLNYACDPKTELNSDYDWPLLMAAWLIRRLLHH